MNTYWPFSKNSAIPNIEEPGSKILENGKYRMAFWICFLAIISVCLYLPVFFSISNFVGTLGICSIIILIGSIFRLTTTKKVEPVLKVTFSILIFFIVFSLVFQAPANPSGYLLWSVLIISSSCFLLSPNWAIGYFVVSFIGLIIISIFQYKEFNLGEYLTGNEFLDISPIGLYSPLKLGTPLLAILLVLIDFVRINRQTDGELTQNLNEKEGLLLQISEKEKTLSYILDSTADAIYELDAQGQVVYGNLEFEKLTGYSLAELKGRDVHFIIPKGFLRSRLKNITLQIRNKERVSYDEFPVKNKSGELIWIGQNTTMVFDDRGNFNRAICTSRNITKQKAIENNLILTKEKAVEASKAKAYFLSSMSHEIRTPMNAIIGIIDLMEADETSEEQIKSLKFSANNLLGLVNNILDYGKLENNKIELKKHDFSIREMANLVRLGLKNLADKKGVSLKFEIEDRIPETIYGDPLRLSQLLNNIVHNAIKFSDNGEVIVDVIRQNENEEKIDIYFAVTDSGIGIPKDKKEIILNGFGQAEDSTIREGAGLGLAISSKLIKLHKSAIHIESEEGLGSKFFFTISFEKRPGSARSSIKGSAKNQSLTRPTDHQPLKGKHILLVEDNLINQKITKKMLEKWEAKVAIAGNGKIAVEQVLTHDFDLILMDLQMPVMNGIDATRHIRGLESKKAKVPMIALTASAVMEIKEEALAAGLDCFISKPFRPDFLFEKLCEFMTSKESKASTKL